MEKLTPNQLQLQRDVTEFFAATAAQDLTVEIKGKSELYVFMQFKKIEVFIYEDGDVDWRFELGSFRKDPKALTLALIEKLKEVLALDAAKPL